MHVVNAIHKHDTLYSVSDVYRHLNNLLKTDRQANDNMKIFKTRFEAPLYRSIAHGTSSIP